MSWKTSDHIKWLAETGEQLTTNDGKAIRVFNFQHEQNEEILSAWARHFRNHYCLDDLIDLLREGTGLSRQQYLEQIKFPDEAPGLGPSIRSGDFGEILVADYLEFLLSYWVPRTRYRNKTIRNESIKGCDVIGFILSEPYSVRDILSIFEVKAQFSGQKCQNKLQKAINDSNKDHARLAESLNAIKQRLIEEQDSNSAAKVERFQNPTDIPYKTNYGAAALFSSNLYDEEVIKESNTGEHTNRDDLSLIIIHGQEMMKLVHELYKRAAYEA